MPAPRELRRGPRPGVIAVADSGSYLNAPESAFGHTFLRLRKRRPPGATESAERLDYGLEPASTAIMKLSGAHIDYFYLSKNCSYGVLTLVEAAAPRVDLVSRLNEVVLPTDTIKAAALLRSSLHGHRSSSVAPASPRLFSFLRPMFLCLVVRLGRRRRSTRRPTAGNARCASRWEVASRRNTATASARSATA